MLYNWRAQSKNDPLIFRPFLKVFRSSWQLLLKTFKNGRKIKGSFLLWAFQLTFSLNKTWGQTFLTHDTPEGSIIKSSGPSGPWELNRTLWEKERCRSFTVQQHTKQNADCSIETFLNVSKKIPAVFFRILDFIYKLGSMTQESWDLKQKLEGKES